MRTEYAHKSNIRIDKEGLTYQDPLRTAQFEIHLETLAGLVLQDDLAHSQYSG